MSSGEPDVTDAWVPEACTLPTTERPLRVADFDALFARSLRSLARPERTRLAMEFEPTPEVGARAADLVVRETACCSFFTFTLIATAGELRLEVAVSPRHVDVLDGLAGRAAEALSLTRLRRAEITRQKGLDPQSA